MPDKSVLYMSNINQIDYEKVLQSNRVNNPGKGLIILPPSKALKYPNMLQNPKFKLVEKINKILLFERAWLEEEEEGDGDLRDNQATVFM